ncbi:molybdate ABC transporter substrate-binding protein [uncultured Corynebacterium sp.]|uniref:molybdate ABC transporter substrate-binding protein n=1 Tax=uncultured Corynebacterium sp. TaxID=159447 RepID=UPI0025F659EE|nr:molybdate ABC transporter substrate-binding protein [uncultured Corynebacterium sp.]
MARRRKARALTPAVLATVALAAGLTACSSDGRADGDRRTLTVFAAASLQQPFEQIEERFEADNPDIDVVASFDGSQNLVDQLGSGAPADVLATADARTMSRAEDAGSVRAPQVFATNVLTLIVPEGNPAGVTGLDDSLDDAKLVVCAPEVPCGAATRELADAAGVDVSPVSEESKVSDVRGKVESGQADAGIVYRTDAALATGVEEIAIDGADEVVNDYPIAVTASAGEDGQRFLDAETWIRAVTSDWGRDILADAGFGPAPTPDGQ